MSKKNYYNVKPLQRVTGKFIKQVERSAAKHLEQVVQKTASENAFRFTFDEAEVVPFGVGTQGAITFATDAEDPFILEDLTRETAMQALDDLKLRITSDLKEALNDQFA